MKERKKTLFFHTRKQLSNCAETVLSNRWVLLLFLFLFLSSSFSAQSIFGDSSVIHISGNAVIYDSGEVYAAKTEIKTRNSEKKIKKEKPKVAITIKAVEKKKYKKIAVKQQNPKHFHGQGKPDQNFSQNSYNKVSGATQNSSFFFLSLSNSNLSVNTITRLQQKLFSAPDFFINENSFQHRNKPPPYVFSLQTQSY